MMNSVAEVVQYLAERDVGFHITHPNPGGSATLTLDSDEVVRYAADPVGFLAQHYGVTREEYLGWHQAGYNVQCGGALLHNSAPMAAERQLSLIDE